MAVCTDAILLVRPALTGKIWPLMLMKQKRIAILGSTGSIGRQTLEVLSQGEDLTACALAAGSNWQLLADQAKQINPQFVAITDPKNASQLQSELPAGVELLTGPDAMTELITRSKPDVVLSGVVGAAGLKPTLAAIELGADLAIANKETLVMAGEIVIPAARDAGVSLLPVDSEHSAIFQCLASGKADEVKLVTITASGGALRDWDDDEAANATVENALNHPTWSMGPKITIDSATMMNKALEVIEAHWLFDLPAEKIKVVIHPESIIHSTVEFRDGSVIAQLAKPDMTLPIAYALFYPDRPARPGEPLDLAEIGNLSFKKLSKRFSRAIDLAYKVINTGGVSGAVLNGANEAAVEAFMAGQIRFGQIVDLAEDILNRAPKADEVTVEALFQADSWARRQVGEAIS